MCKVKTTWSYIEELKDTAMIEHKASKIPKTVNVLTGTLII